MVIAVFNVIRYVRSAVYPLAWAGSGAESDDVVCGQ